MFKHILRAIKDGYRKIFPAHQIAEMTVIFLAWKSESARNGRSDTKGNGSVSYYMEELATGRESPPFPDGLLFVDVMRDELSESGTQPNSPLRIRYQPERISPNQIMGYLDHVGLRISF
jgi:hypothetical protein